MYLEKSEARNDAACSVEISPCIVRQIKFVFERFIPMASLSYLHSVGFLDCRRPNESAPG